MNERRVLRLSRFRPAGLMVGLLAAVVPATWAAGAPLSSLLSSASVRWRRAQPNAPGTGVVLVALSLVLLSGGGLVVGSFERRLRADPGFDPAATLTFRIPLPIQILPDTADAAAVQARLLAGLAALNGVSSVGAVDALPMRANANQSSIGIPGAPGNTGDPDRDTPLVDYIGARAGSRRAAPSARRSRFSATP